MISGKNVRLRAITRSDLPAFVDWLNDPEVRRNLSIYYPLSIEQEEKWYQDMLAHPVEEQPLSIEINKAGKWVLVGDIGFINYDQQTRSAEIGIFVGRKDAWDKGFGTEAMRLMIGYGFNHLNLNRIFLRVFETNARAIHCYEKAGFKHEGRLRQACFLDGEYKDVLMMSILKSELSKKTKDRD